MYRKNVRIVGGILCLFLIAFKGRSQDSANTINKISISSPTAASLGKYGDYPVNYNTGTPNISIPLYTIKSKDIIVPISLSYHASGLKVQEIAGWVGAGWTLNAGGVITRTVVGTPDDRGNGPTTFTHGHYSDYGYNNYLFVAGSGYGVTLDGKLPDDGGFLNGYKDGEPDIFTFNFNGISGKFYFNDDRSVVTVPEMDLKFQTDFTLGTGFTGFVVTTSDGTKYYFGKSGNNTIVNPIELSIPMTQQDGPAYSQKAYSSWYLNKIVNVDNTDSVLFTYATENFAYYTLSMFPVSFYSKSTLGSSQKSGYNLVKNLVQGMRLTGITFLNGSITFSPSSAARTDLTGYGTNTVAEDPSFPSTAYSLGDIQVSNNNGLCKKFVFKYGYFQDNAALQGPVLSTYSSTIQSDKKHLRLDTLTEMSCDASLQVSPYIFNYYSETVRRSLSLGMDHWGYANGITSNTTLIPMHYVKYNNLITKKDGASRDAVFPAMRGGALQKITFPTGGYTQFDYEPHTTYVEYDTYTFIQRLSMSAGYDGHNGYLGDGGSNPIENAYTFSGNQYDLLVTNTDNPNISSENAYVTIYNSTHTAALFSSPAIAPGEQKIFTIQLGAGLKYVQLSKTNATTGNGAFLSLTEKVPTPVAANDTVGGLRIKTITTNNGVNANNIVTNYSYNVGTNSSGILYSRPVYVKFPRNKTWNDVFWGAGQNCELLIAGAPGGGLEAYVSDQYYMSPVSVRPMQTVQGNHIGYNEVKVSQTANGYSIYRYYGSNFWDNRISDVCGRIVDWDNNCDPDVPETPAAPINVEPMRGELKFEGHYNESGQVLKSVWHFPIFQQYGIITPGHITTSANAYGVYTEYMLTSYRKLIDSVEETMYDPVAGSNITTKKVQYFTSKYHHEPTQIASYSSKNDRITTNLSYVFDFLPSTSTNINDSIASYLTNIHNDSIVYYDTLPKCIPQTNDITGCRYSQHIQFRRFINLHRLSFMTYRRDTYTPNFNGAQDAAETAAGTDLKPVLEMQDLYQNRVLEQSNWRNSLLLNAQYTTFAFSTNPSGKVYPSLLQDISVYSPTSTFTKAVVNGSNNGITRDSRYKDNTTFKFDLGNLVEITGRDGVTTSYKWGLNNTQPVVEAQGVTYAILNAAYTAVSGNLSTLRSQPSLAGAFLTTYTYTPLAGISTETSPTLQKFSYEYDGLFRLQHVKDRYNNILKRYEYKYQRPVTD